MEQKWRKTSELCNVLNPDSPYGWIDKDGQFYGCASSDHKYVARVLFSLSERAMEEQGFVKVFRDYDGSINYYCTRLRLTEKQAETLQKRNIIRKEDWCG